MNGPSIILIRGLPGSGKSSLARLLSENGKYPVFSIDDYFMDKEIMDNLNTSDIILLMVSSDFNYSDYCYKELQIALERYKKNEVVLVPIIVRPCDWQDTEFAKMNALPTGGEPIVKWTLEDDAYLNIVNNIKKILTIN